MGARPWPRSSSGRSTRERRRRSTKTVTPAGPISQRCMYVVVDTGMKCLQPGRIDRYFDHETGARRAGALHPDPPVVEPDVLGDEGQAEADAATAPPVTGLGRAAVEP